MGIKKDYIETARQAIASGTAVCDFCKGPQPTWDYNIKDFSVAALAGKETVNFDSLGGWACCAFCHEHLQRKDFRPMVERYCQIDVDRKPEQIDYELLIFLWKHALKMQIGEPQLVEEMLNG